ncbi:cytochrome P450 alkane hydroxylase [Podospora fimiseda]|uniref:Cytochrome P450 alkane hydroxylase n=1 Tax=Podospora fimiseda TaxID=252190 RepID=A0AAN6YKU6_9PEZI|nr:cytochrome P450 alkane hydroxylase [Podospora fimiseda]
MPLLKGREKNFGEIKNCVIDLQPMFFKLTFDTTMFLLFGEEIRVVGKDAEKFVEAFNIAQGCLAQRGRLEACKVCHGTVDEGDKKVIRDQLLNVLLAGRDTTGCCLQWTFPLLARHQDVLAKVREEIKRIVGVGRDAPQPTRDHLKRMTYLNLVIKEVLRLYPSVPVNSREAIRLTTLPLVRPGEGVGYCVYAMHRRKDIYGEDAEEFRPERWEGGALKDVGWGYLPFNGGPRLCLGQEFTLLEVSYTVARMVQVFSKIEVPPGEVLVAVGEEKQNLTLVVSSADGCWVLMKS